MQARHLPCNLRVSGGINESIRVSAADYLDSALREIAEHQLDLWLRIMPYGGGFQPRLIRGGDEWSMHSFGLAHDFDPAQNPLGWLPRDCRLGSTPEGT